MTNIDPDAQRQAEDERGAEAYEREQIDALTVVDCLDFDPNGWGLGDPDGCAGPVEWRMPLSGTGRSFPRCETHWDRRLEEQERINRDYPDSPIAPSWFDPADAGERWDDDY